MQKVAETWKLNFKKSIKRQEKSFCILLGFRAKTGRIAQAGARENRSFLQWNAAVDDQAAEKARGTPWILAANEVIGEEGGKDVAQSYPASPESHYLQSQFSSTRVAAGLTRQLGLKPLGSQGTAEWSTYLERTQGLYDSRSVTSRSRLRSVDQYDYPCLSLSIHHSSCVRGKMIWRSTEKSREQGPPHTWSAERYNVACVRDHSPQAPSATPDHEDNPHCAVRVPTLNHHPPTQVVPSSRFKPRIHLSLGPELSDKHPLKPRKADLPPSRSHCDSTFSLGFCLSHIIDSALLG